MPRVIFSMDVDTGSFRFRQGVNYDLDTRRASHYTTIGVAVYVNTDAPAFSAGGGGATTITPTQLTGDRTLSASDDGSVFYTAVPIIITVPAGMSPAPWVRVKMSGSGSVTWRSSGGTLINGSTADSTPRTFSTDPNGVDLEPVYSVANSYTLTNGTTAIASLTGVISDSSVLQTAFDQKRGFTKQQKMTTGFAADSTRMGTQFSYNAGVARILTMVTGQDLSFYFGIARFAPGAADFTLSVPTGITLQTPTEVVTGPATRRLITNGQTGVVWCTGVLDTYQTDAPLVA